MSKRKMIAYALGSSLLLSVSQLSAAPNGQLIADTCAGCHGTDGASVGPAIPNLAGYSAQYMLDSMNAFKNGERHGTIMGRIAKGYTEEETAAMAQVFAALPVYKAAQETDPAKVAMGGPLFDDGCANCHENAGSSPGDDAGILAGQWLPYLTYSMEDFKSGARAMPTRMKRSLDRLSDEQVDAINHYLASQQ
jgi:sulfide dehydrogenase cytochrome subunit